MSVLDIDFASLPGRSYPLGQVDGPGLLACEGARAAHQDLALMSGLGRLPDTPDALSPAQKDALRAAAGDIEALVMGSFAHTFGKEKEGRGYQLAGLCAASGASLALGIKHAACDSIDQRAGLLDRVREQPETRAAARHAAGEIHRALFADDADAVLRHFPALVPILPALDDAWDTLREALADRGLGELMPPDDPARTTLAGHRLPDPAGLAAALTDALQYELVNLVPARAGASLMLVAGAFLPAAGHRVSDVPAWMIETARRHDPHPWRGTPDRRAAIAAAG